MNDMTGHATLGPATYPATYVACEVALRNLLGSLGYAIIQPVPIASGIDPSVRFIGSHISVLKPYVLQPNSLSAPGVAMIQQCVRTRNLKTALSVEGVPTWGSTFPSLGILTSYARLVEVIPDVSRCFSEVFGVKPSETVLRVSPDDADLVNAAQAWGARSVELGTRPAEYYRHSIGVPGVVGRSFNMAIQFSDSRQFDDVGNIIVLEGQQGGAVVEVALGITTILRQTSGSRHILDFGPAHGLFDGPEPIVRRLEDAIGTCIVLFRDGVTLTSDNRGRLLRRYVLSLVLNASRLGISLPQLRTIIEGAAAREPYLADIPVTNVLVRAVDRLHEHLLADPELAPAENAVALEMRGHG